MRRQGLREQREAEEAGGRTDLSFRGFRVEGFRGLGFRVEGFRVQGLGFRV